MSKHTKGPWRVEEVGGWGICVRAMKDTYVAWRLKSKANAHLIAAAPDLLDFAKTLENDDGIIPDWLWKMRNEVIAKAEGK